MKGRARNAICAGSGERCSALPRASRGGGRAAPDQRAHDVQAVAVLPAAARQHGHEREQQAHHAVLRAARRRSARRVSQAAQDAACKETLESWMPQHRGG